MEAVGRLTGGIAHDFNNILTVILGYTGLALGALDEGSEAHELITEVRKAADRAAGLTKQLMAFSRQQVLTPQVLSLNAVVMDMAQMLRRVIGEPIHLALDLDPREPRIHADASQVEQVLMNLAVNARDAMPNGGRLRIETQAVPATEGPGQVRIRVSDTGVGMDADTRGRVFEPFFTTKERTKGTGLGLATVHGIVTQSHGEITVDSEPGQGTAFTILLPATDAPLTPEPYELEAGGSQRSPWTILLVEDEPGVRSLFGDILTKEGYRVLRAADAESAVQIAMDHPGMIDLLLTDVVMPKQSGRQLAERLHPSRPEMRVLFMSGYADKILESERNEFAFLQKPCGRSELTRKVREVLER
jgi:CheY-like chemotaxis protein/anti-sigma regulatory factor (Ser/Thr protein kinase)